MRNLLVTAAICLAYGCVRNQATLPIGDSLAYVPVYASLTNPENIEIASVKPTENPGKIYVYQQYIFQNELHKGVHIIDNSDPKNPVKRAFLSIPYNTDMAIRNSYVYANSVNDLVVIDISDPLHPRLVSRTKDAFPMISQEYPPAQGYFVCPDPSKGMVVDWKLETVKTPACRR